MPKPQYRIVNDSFSGYEVQVKRWWWPWWYCVGFNTHPSVERARQYAKHLQNPYVEYL